MIAATATRDPHNNKPMTTAWMTMQNRPYDGDVTTIRRCRHRRHRLAPTSMTMTAMETTTMDDNNDDDRCNDG